MTSAVRKVTDGPIFTCSLRLFGDANHGNGAFRVYLEKDHALSSAVLQIEEAFTEFISPSRKGC